MKKKTGAVETISPKVLPVMNQVITQGEFADIVGVSGARISQLIADGVLPRGETCHKMLIVYCDRIRDQAAGRKGESVGGLDLVQERAGLAREQRLSQELKNQVSRGEYAPIGLLADVLGKAASAVVDRFDQLEGVLRKSCPDIDESVMTAVLHTVSGARNQWIKSTSKMISDELNALADASEAEEEFENGED